MYVCVGSSKTSCRCSTNCVIVLWGELDGFVAFGGKTINYMNNSVIMLLHNGHLPTYVCTCINYMAMYICLCACNLIAICLYVCFISNIHPCVHACIHMGCIPFVFLVSVITGSFGV